MGGRGSLGNREFMFTTKESVWDAMQKKKIRLMKDGVPVTDLAKITNKELATLSMVVTHMPKDHKVIDLTNKYQGEYATESQFLMKSSNKMLDSKTSVRSVLVNSFAVKKGYRYINKQYKAKYKGGMKEALTTMEKVYLEKQEAKKTKPKPKKLNKNPKTTNTNKKNTKGSTRAKQVKDDNYYAEKLANIFK